MHLGVTKNQEIGKLKTFTFFWMGKSIFDKSWPSRSIYSGILFVSNWPQKYSPLWKVQFLIIIFLEIWGQIQIPLKKVCTQTALLFSKFPWEVGQIKQKCSFLKVSLTYPRFLRYFTYLTNFQLEFWKKESSLCTQFFGRNLNLASDF